MKTATLTESAPLPILKLHAGQMPAHCERVKLLMAMFGLSLANVVNGSGRSISKSQLHRILNGQVPSAFEKKSIAAGLMACVGERCDSAFLFEDRSHE